MTRNGRRSQTIKQPLSQAVVTGLDPYPQCKLLSFADNRGDKLFVEKSFRSGPSDYHSGTASHTCSSFGNVDLTEAAANG